MPKHRSSANGDNHDSSIIIDSGSGGAGSSSGNGSSSTVGGSSSSNIIGDVEVKRSVKSIVQGITQKLTSHQLNRPSSWTKNNEV